MTNIGGIHCVFIWFFLLHLWSILSFEKQKAGTKLSSISLVIDMRNLTHFHSQMVHNWYRDLKDTNELAQRIHENNDENLGRWISAPACKWWTNHFNLKKKKKKNHKKNLEKGKTRLFLNPAEDRCCLSEIWRKCVLERDLDSLQKLLGPYTVRTL